MNTEQVPTPRTGLAGALDTIKAFVSTYRILCFVLFLLLIGYFGFVRPVTRENTKLTDDNKALQAQVNLLRPKCPCDTLTP